MLTLADWPRNHWLIWRHASRPLLGRPTHASEGRLEVSCVPITHVHTYTQIFLCMHTIYAPYTLTRTLTQYD